LHDVRSKTAACVTTTGTIPTTVFHINDAIAIGVFLRIRLTIAIGVPAGQSVFTIHTGRTVFAIFTGRTFFSTFSRSSVFTG
jgi:hypothetical protein